MKPDKTIKRLLKSPKDKETLKLTALDLGDEIVRLRVDVLRDFKNKLGGVPSEKGTYEDGFLDALAWVTAAATAYLEEIEYREYLKGAYNATQPKSE